MKILVVTDGLEPLLHLTVVGLAERGHQVRVVGALSPDELDPEDRFRVGASLRVTGGEPGGECDENGKCEDADGRGRGQGGIPLLAGRAPTGRLSHARPPARNR